MKYKLELTENQLKVVKSALEDYFRQRMGQFFELPDDIAFDGYDRNKHDNIDFKERIARRDAGKSLLESAYKLMRPEWNLPKMQNCMIAEDMWRVIRYALWMQRPEKERAQIPWCVDGDKPIKISDEPMIKVEADKK